MRIARSLTRSRSTWHETVWLVPSVYLAVAVVAGQVVPELDGGAEGLGRPLLAVVAIGMLAFAGGVVPTVLLVVQAGAARLSPRLVAWTRRDPLLRHATGMFLATVGFALSGLAAVAGDDGPGDVPILTCLVGVGSVVVSLVLFLLVVERMTLGLRPAAVAQRLAGEARKALRRTSPPAGDGDGPGPHRSALEAPPQHEVRLTRSDGGTVRAVEARELQRSIRRAGTFVELVPALGEHVDRGAVLYRVHGELLRDELPRLERSVVLGDERAVDRDPAFAFRLLVDIAITALSSVAKDPTTAVQVIDWLQSLLADAAGRRLGTGVVAGRGGEVVAVYHGATWDDLVMLSFEEILFYGREDLQVTRRMRAALDDLLAVVPPHRRAPLISLRHRLESTTFWSFEQAGTRAVALQGDRLGLGGAAAPPPVRAGVPPEETVAGATPLAPNGSGGADGAEASEAATGPAPATDPVDPGPMRVHDAAPPAP